MVTMNKKETELYREIELDEITYYRFCKYRRSDETDDCLLNRLLDEIQQS